MVDLDEEDKFKAGDYGYRYLVRLGYGLCEVVDGVAMRYS